MEKAERVLDLYHGRWEGKPLTIGDYVLCIDERPGIQIRERRHPASPPTRGRPGLYEFEYRRHGTVVYLAAWDAIRARVFGEVETRCTIPTFDRFLGAVLGREPYRSANRVFLVIDNGTVHRGQAFINRVRESWPQAIPVHLPIHASWLNQVEIYLSILKRKVLVPDDFATPDVARTTILEFQRYYDEIAQPFSWKFSKDDLRGLLSSIEVPTATT